MMLQNEQKKYFSMSKQVLIPQPTETKKASKCNSFFKTTSTTSKINNTTDVETTTSTKGAPSASSVFVIRNWLSKTESDDLLKQLQKDIKFEQHPVVVYGKSFMQPRQIYACGNSTVKTHNYSGLELPVHDWHPVVKAIRDRIEREYHWPANSCLLNEYKNGPQYISWHSDKEVNKHFNSGVYTVSLGASRDFYLRRKDDHTRVIKTTLHAGDLCVMEGSTQQEYEHSVPKRTQAGYRISLTFRILEHGKQ